MHAECPCNEVISIRNRVIGVVPKPTPLGLSKLYHTLKQMRRCVGPVSPISYSEFYQNYTGSKRKAYEEAAKTLGAYPICKRDSQINMFVKCERINPIEKVNPDPRPISARNKRYVLSVGVWLKPLEHQVYKSRFGFRSRVIVKGLNPTERAKLLVRKWSQFDSPVVLSIDCSRWDKHVSRELLLLEHGFYNSRCNDSELAKLLSWQLINRCKSRTGIRYTVCGRRMSGDYNTALGNCLLMTAMVKAYMDPLGIHYDMMDDGDDCLIIVEKKDEHMLIDITNSFLQFGHEVKLENRAECLESVVFCQSSPIEIRPQSWKFVRNPVKVMSNATSGFLKLRNVSLRSKMFYAIGSCELALNIGVPVLQEFALKLISLGTPVDVHKLLDNSSDFQDMAYRVRSVPLDQVPVEITETARLDFMTAFGITVQEQYDIENVIRRWNPDIFSEYEIPHCYLRELRIAADISLTGV